MFNSLPNNTVSGKLICVIRAPHASNYEKIIEILVESGVRSVELTLSTPGTFAEIINLKEKISNLVDIGVGTVTTIDEVREAKESGADYIVTPVSNTELVFEAATLGLPIIPGGFTPTEIFNLWSLSIAPAIKLFPANLVSPNYLKDLRGPFPNIQIIPSGGVSEKNAKKWLEMGATAICVGGPLLGNIFIDKDYEGLKTRARNFVSICQE